MEMWVATSNLGKVKELERLLTPFGVVVKSLKDAPSVSMPPENGKTFVENARIKARALRSVKNTSWVMGEDSGLEAEGLGGLPGIHSARYAGDRASDMENYTKLLKMLSLRTTNRNARFVCTMVLFDPEGQEYHFEGELKGTICPAARGTTGFGYDPVFVPAGENQTLAELGPATKNKVSHRARAVEKMVAELGARWGSSPVVP